ncbi:sarcoplasmic calcium-binding protein-like [Lingula anatina]|uniref:Sarcoplasmic calcium-binding protein-like n=1 Tax=Lingula anatina TaxID=7574 RepID=A0A1S3JAY6_LINAN|nr:sarcoplasmic calcium-binding protein-like [Lingula anatina]|eukprot:XP_013407488.1 sarcoplasmic calcium-binding protein-like [Lingula anatina]
MAGVARILSKCFPNGIIYRSFTQKAVNLKRTPQDYPALNGSEHWRRKIRTLFRARDIDGDGYLTKKDYEMNVHRVSSYMNLNENQAKDLMKWKLFVWEKLSGSTDASADFRLPEDDYVSNMLAAYPIIVEKIVDIASCDFDTVDIDGDGFISPQEHKACFYGFGIPLKHSTDVFKVLDTDGDGKISRQEFVQGFVDYILSEDENSPHACFFGPLV